jgi:CMP/dCMP kinase
MIISFAGAMGSGKSTIAKMLAAELGWPRYYIGGIRREIAKQRGLTLAEFNKLGETDPTTDSEVDEYQKRLGKTQDNFIIEGRTSWYFIPQSLKIYLDVTEEEGAHRIFAELQSNNNRNEDSIKTYNDALDSIRQRKKSDTERYKKYYQIDAYDKKNYDFVVDTTNLTIEEVFDQVLIFVKSKFAK